MGLTIYTHGANFGPSTQAYWDGQSFYSGTTKGAAPDDRQVQWSDLSFVFTRTTPSTISDDVMVTSLAFAKETLSFGSSILGSSDKALVEGRADTMFTTLKALMPSHLTLLEYRWHDYDQSWTKPGPATRVTSKNVACTGAATNVVPDQVATTVTFKTASRKHWGRMYWPQLISTAYSSTGRLSTGNTDTFVGAVHTFLNGCDTDGNEPVVASNVHGGILAISELQMDNTPDVIRRRRAKHVEYRKSYTS